MRDLTAEERERLKALLHLCDGAEHYLAGKREWDARDEALESLVRENGDLAAKLKEREDILDFAWQRGDKAEAALARLREAVADVVTNAGRFDNYDRLKACAGRGGTMSERELSAEERAEVERVMGCGREDSHNATVWDAVASLLRENGDLRQLGNDVVQDWNHERRRADKAEAALARLRRALTHQMHRNHPFNSRACSGCNDALRALAEEEK